MDIKIGIAGVTGRVGRLITQEVQSQTHQDTIKIASGLAADPSPAPLSFPSFADKNLDDFIRPTDCIIDFSTPDLTLSLARALQSSKKNQYLVAAQPVLRPHRWKSWKPCPNIFQFYMPQICRWE